MGLGTDNGTGNDVLARAGESRTGLTPSHNEDWHRHLATGLGSRLASGLAMILATMLATGLANMELAMGGTGSGSGNVSRWKNRTSAASGGGGISDAYTPTEIQDISEKACLAAAKLWKKECDAAKCRGAEPPDPPLNLEQRAFCRKVLPALLTMRGGRR